MTSPVLLDILFPLSSTERVVHADRVYLHRRDVGTALWLRARADNAKGVRTAPAASAKLHRELLDILDRATWQPCEPKELVARLRALRPTAPGGQVLVGGVPLLVDTILPLLFDLPWRRVEWAAVQVPLKEREKPPLYPHLPSGFALRNSLGDRMLIARGSGREGMPEVQP